MRQDAKERSSIASKGGKSASSTSTSTSEECESHDAHDTDNKANTSAALELEIDRLVESISKLRKELRGA